MRWLYNQHFAAVGGDTVAFEAWPPKIHAGFCLHEWLLVQWGTPIGECSLSLCLPGNLYPCEFVRARGIEKY